RSRSDDRLSYRVCGGLGAPLSPRRPPARTNLPQSSAGPIELSGNAGYLNEPDALTARARRRKAAPSPISPVGSKVIVEGSGTGGLIARWLMAMVAGQSLNSSSVVPAGRFKIPLDPRSCGASSLL